MTSLPPRPRTRPALLTAAMTVLAWTGGAFLTAPAFAGSTAQTEVEAEQVDVSSKLQPGETFRYSIRSRQVRQRQKPDESIIKWINRRAALISCEVLEPDPKIGPRVRVTFDELNITVMTPDRARRFTSASKYANTLGAPMTLAMEPIVGAEITLTLDETGEIRRIEGADRLLKEKELRQYAEHIVGDEAIRQMIGPIFHSLARPSGDRESEPWTSTRRMEFPEIATFDFTERWLLKRREAGRATFQITSDTVATIDEHWPKAVLKDSRTIGSYTWDELTGRLVHTEINRFYIVELENDPDGPSIAGEEVLTISAPLGED